MEIKIKRILNDAILPSYAHGGDAGMDIFSCEDIAIFPGERKKISTGIKMEIPENYVGLVWDKSGLAVNYGIKTMAGVVDSGYRGEIMVVLINLSNEKFEIKKGQKIAQILIQKIEKAEIIEDGELSKTARNEDGFGSTGNFK